MKVKYPLFVALVGSLSLGTGALAQAVAPVVPPTPKEEALVLSPFVVNTTTDRATPPPARSAAPASIPS